MNGVRPGPKSIVSSRSTSFEPRFLPAVELGREESFSLASAAAAALAFFCGLASLAVDFAAAGFLGCAFVDSETQFVDISTHSVRLLLGVSDFSPACAFLGSAFSFFGGDFFGDFLDDCSSFSIFFSTSFSSSRRALCSMGKGTTSS